MSTKTKPAAQTGDLVPPRSKPAKDEGRSRQRHALVTTIDAHGVTHLSLPSGDVAYWIRCGVEL